MRNYFVYILTNKNKTVLYVGVTNDLERRLHEHVTGLNDGFTSRYGCHFLIYFEQYNFIDDAIKREKVIKGWRREKKNALIESVNPNWQFITKINF